MPPMNRREALKAAGLIAGGAFLASDGILAACRGETRARPRDRLLNADQQSLAEEIADTLLPTTASSPGAKAAGVGPAMNLIVSDCYKAEDRTAGAERSRDIPHDLSLEAWQGLRRPNANGPRVLRAKGGE